MKYTSNCHCGQINIELDLPKDIKAYTPRACDCDYCTAKNAMYLSDPQSVLTINPANSLKAEQQGSMQASFWLCNICDDLIAVSCQYEDKMIGAVNADILARNHDIQAGLPASPKTLSPNEKTDRWQQVWGEINIKE